MMEIQDVHSKKMNTALIISKNMTQVRLAPNGTSDTKIVLDRGPIEYHTTCIKQGWYYIVELNGWVYYKDVYIPRPEEIIPENEIVSVESEVTRPDEKPINPDERTDGDEIIESINKSSDTKSILGKKVILKIDGNKIIDLNTAIQSIHTDLDNLSTMKIPDVPQDMENGVLTCTQTPDGDIKLSWVEQKSDNGIVIDNEF